MLPAMLTPPTPPAIPVRLLELRPLSRVSRLLGRGCLPGINMPRNFKSPCDVAVIWPETIAIASRGDHRVHNLGRNVRSSNMQAQHKFLQDVPETQSERCRLPIGRCKQWLCGSMKHFDRRRVAAV